MKNFDFYAQCYDLLYNDKDYVSEVSYIQRLLEAHSSIDVKNILTLGCGTGKHDIAFAEKGYSSHGVDISENMVKLANKNNGAADTRFSVGDIREIRLNRRFNAVVSLFHVMNYQLRNEDIISSFRTASEHLEDGGVFIFDSWYGPGVLRDLPVVRIKRLENEQIELTRIAEPTLRPNDNVVDVNYEVLIKNKKTSSYEKINELHRMRYLFIPEVEFLLKYSGFNLTHYEQWMTGNSPTENTWYICFVCKKFK